MRHLPWLFFNHGDAWAVTFGICFMAMLFHRAFTPQAWLLAVGMAIGYWMGFALNDYFDSPDDATEPAKARRNFFALVQMPTWGVALLFGITFCVIFWIFIQYGVWAPLVILISCLVMWVYSAPPFRLKYRPVWDLLSHMLFVESYPYLVFMLLLGLPWLAVDKLMYGLLILASLSAQLEQQLRDYEVDKANGNSFTVAVGRPAANAMLRLITVGIVGGLIAGFVTDTLPLFMLPLALLATPILWHRVKGHAEKEGRWQTAGTVILVSGLVYLAGLTIAWLAFGVDVLA